MDDSSSVGDETRFQNNSVAFGNGNTIDNSRVLGDQEDEEDDQKSDSEEGKSSPYLFLLP